MALHRSTSLFGALAVASLFVLGAPGQAKAQKLPPSVVAVVDTQILLAQSTVGKDLLEQIKALRIKYQPEFDRRVAALRAEQAELQRQQTILAPEAFKAKEQLYRQKVASAQKFEQDTIRSINQAMSNARQEVVNTVLNIVSEMSAQYGFNLVLERSPVIFRLESTDLTSQVLERLNKRLPKVVVRFPVQE